MSAHSVYSSSRSVECSGKKVVKTRCETSASGSSSAPCISGGSDGSAAASMIEKMRRWRSSAEKRRTPRTITCASLSPPLAEMHVAGLRANIRRLARVNASYATVSFFPSFRPLELSFMSISRRSASCSSRDCGAVSLTNIRLPSRDFCLTTRRPTYLSLSSVSPRAAFRSSIFVSVSLRSRPLVASPFTASSFPPKHRSNSDFFASFSSSSFATSSSSAYTKMTSAFSPRAADFCTSASMSRSSGSSMSVAFRSVSSCELRRRL